MSLRSEQPNWRSASELSPSQRKAELEALCLELARRERDERIRYFKPHGGQEEFIALLAEPDPFILVGGEGNGWGKTEMIIAISAAIMWPALASPAFSAPIFKEWPHPKRARIYSKPAELEELGALQSAIVKYFPKGRYTSSKGRYNYPSVFKTDTGWLMDLFSYERHESEAAGPNIGLQIFNEPPPEPLFKEAQARTRSGGIILGGMTSLLDQPWVVDGIFNAADGKRIRVHFGDVEQNCKQHGKNGNLEHSRIEEILAGYDPDEREARKTGKPLSLSGRIFKTFDRSVHVAKEPIVPHKLHAKHYCVMDPAIGKPCFILWAQALPSGQVQIYDEWPEFDFEGAKDSNLGVKEYADIIRQREAGHGSQYVSRILDRHFGNSRRTMGGLTLKQEFAAAGLSFRDSYAMEPSVEVETGIMKVKDFLRYDKTKPMDSFNQPRLIVSPTCRNTIAALERWGRDPKTGKPKEEYKDASDCVRYLAMSNPAWEQDVEWQEPEGPSYGVRS